MVTSKTPTKRKPRAAQTERKRKRLGGVPVAHSTEHYTIEIIPMMQSSTTVHVITRDDVHGKLDRRQVEHYLDEMVDKVTAKAIAGMVKRQGFAVFTTGVLGWIDHDGDGEW